MLAAAAEGRFPDAAEPIVVVPSPRPLAGAIVAFTGCTYVAADVDCDELESHLGANRLAGPVEPRFVQWLAGRVNGRARNHEVILAGIGTGSRPDAFQPEPNWPDHERAGHGARLRRDVHGWTYRDGQGIVLIGRGLVDRLEIAYETAPDAPAGTGSAMVRDALGLVPAGTPLFAQVAPGNARSLRAALAAGYRPLGGETLIET